MGLRPTAAYQLPGLRRDDLLRSKLMADGRDSSPCPMGRDTDCPRGHARGPETRVFAQAIGSTDNFTVAYGHVSRETWCEERSAVAELPPEKPPTE